MSSDADDSSPVHGVGVGPGSSSLDSTPERIRSIALALFFLYFGLYGLSASGHLYLGDAWSLLETSRAIVLHGTLSIDFDPGFGGTFDDQGRFYSQYGLGAAIGAIPAALAGELLAYLAANPTLDHLLRGLPLSFMNVLWCASLIAVFFMLASRETDEKTAKTLAHLLALTSLIWPYSGYDASEPLVGLLLLISLIPVTPEADTRSCTLAGFVFGGAVLVKFTSLLILPGYLYRLWELKSRRTAAFILGPTMAVLTILTYNQLRFGNPLTTGYAVEVQTFRIPIWMGIYGLIFSIGKGLFIYQPPLGLVGLIPRRDPTASYALWPTWIVASVAPSVLFFAWHQNWDGDWSYGPRYLVPLLPLMYLTLIPYLEEPTRFGRSAIMALTALGIIVQAAGVFVDPTDHVKFLSHHKAALGDYLAQDRGKVHIPFHAHHFNPDFSPIRGHFYLLASWIQRQRGLEIPPMILYSTVEEENDRSGHRLTPRVELRVPDPDLGQPDIWWILLLPLVLIHPLLSCLYLLGLATFVRAFTLGRARMRRLDRLSGRS